MSDRDTIHLLDELQHARSLADSMERAFRQANLRCVDLMDEVDRLKKAVIENTRVDVRGTMYWPQWVTETFGPMDRGEE